jgi:hypothetical protein
MLNVAQEVCQPNYWQSLKCFKAIDRLTVYFKIRVNTKSVFRKLRWHFTAPEFTSLLRVPLLQLCSRRAASNIKSSVGLNEILLNCVRIQSLQLIDA